MPIRCQAGLQCIPPPGSSPPSHPDSASGGTCQTPPPPARTPSPVTGPLCYGRCSLQASGQGCRRGYVCATSIGVGSHISGSNQPVSDHVTVNQQSQGDQAAFTGQTMPVAAADSPGLPLRGTCANETIFFKAEPVESQIPVDSLPYTDLLCDSGSSINCADQQPNAAARMPSNSNQDQVTSGQPAEGGGDLGAGSLGSEELSFPCTLGDDTGIGACPTGMRCFVPLASLMVETFAPVTGQCVPTGRCTI